MKVKYACQNICPLASPNDGLVKRLSLIAQAREISGEPMNALAYRRASAVIKSLRRPIESPADIKVVSGIGPKIIQIIQEWISSGDIAEYALLVSDDRLRCVNELQQVYGIGPTTAVKFYNEGIRSMADLQHIDDLTEDIEREEARAIVGLVRGTFHSRYPGIETVCVGGFRRGKKASRDLDILLVVRDESLVADIMVTIQSGLADEGRFIGTLSRAMASASGEADLDHLFLLVRCPVTERVRQVDLVFCSREDRATALLAWTGSAQFERSIRLYAKKEMGIALSARHMTCISTGNTVKARTEREIFAILGLPYLVFHTTAISQQH